MQSQTNQQQQQYLFPSQNCPNVEFKICGHPNSRVRMPGLKSQIHYVLFAWLHCASLLYCKMEMMIIIGPTLGILVRFKCVNKMIRIVPVTYYMLCQGEPPLISYWQYQWTPQSHLKIYEMRIETSAFFILLNSFGSQRKYCS